MITGERYIEKVKLYYSFLVTDFGFKLGKEKINGNIYYEAQYEDISRVISISYENIENVFFVIIYLLENGQLPNYDDKTHTLHLNALNASIISKLDKSKILLNNNFFKKFKPENNLEKELLKAAKELRLCLQNISKLQQ